MKDGFESRFVTDLLFGIMLVKNHQGVILIKDS